MPARARPAATVSSSSPTANRKITTEASSAAPIAIAPAAATVIRVSMLKGVPDKRAGERAAGEGRKSNERGDAVSPMRQIGPDRGDREGHRNERPQTEGHRPFRVFHQA